jgi:DNA adenine methylase
MTQLPLFSREPPGEEYQVHRTRPQGQLLKWVGNKHKHAEQIVSMFPPAFGKYFEPFVGTGAVLATLAPQDAVAGDTLEPLIDFWHLVQSDPDTLIDYYTRTHQAYLEDPNGTYRSVRESFNESPNPLDMLFISRSCYGGVMRFTRDGKISTPIGPHKPILPATFEKRLRIWRKRVRHVEFMLADFRQTMAKAKRGDLLYCDPPYKDTQSILYGAQAFRLDDLWQAIQRCVAKRAKVALSIDGSKKSGNRTIELDIPDDLFKRELMLKRGASMLRRFQKQGETMEGEIVHDRLLLSW